MALNAFGETVRELFIRHGMDEWSWQIKLARKLDENGHGGKFAPKDRRKQINRVFQRKQAGNIPSTLVIGIRDALKLDEDEVVELLDSYHQAREQGWQDAMSEARGRL